MGRSAVLIVAAGRGVRAGGGAVPKQYQALGGTAVLRLTIDRFLSHPSNLQVICVIGEDDYVHYDAIAPKSSRLLPPVPGGENRQASVLKGLQALAGQDIDKVLIHDGVRPFADSDLIDRVLSGLEAADAVLPALPISATLKSVRTNGLVSGTVPREGLYAAQTPQGFRMGVILGAHLGAKEQDAIHTDDAAVAESAGVPVRIVLGDEANIKLTTASDLKLADNRIRMETTLSLGDVRVGSGYDVHAFGAGNSVMIGGVRIPHDRGVDSHSDGDVALHALTDAILGAIAEGDIGVHFPPSDPQWRDASSDRFVEFAVDRLKERGGRIAHLNIMVVAESPKLAPYRSEMRNRIAEICGIDPDRVAIQATTNEKLGFLGRGEGLAAMATATIRLPFEE